MRLIAAVLLLLGLSTCGRTPSAPQVGAGVLATERPLILTQDQGEVRFWRPLVSESLAEQKLDVHSRFIIKVDRQAGGSPDFWFGSEVLPPGAGIPYHRHLHEDEVVYIVSGKAHVNVGSLAGAAGPGAMVFIPRDTWVSIQSAGKTPISLVFAFNAPGFDRYMRCESARVGQPARPVAVDEDKGCMKMGDVQYR